MAKFADFADTELNTGKSFVTGYDFSHRKELEISLRYLGNKKTGYFIAETAKGYIRAPVITRKRPVPRGKTAPFRSIGWVPAPAPVPTSERGHDSQRDRLNQPRGFEPGTSSFRGGRFAHCATWTPWLDEQRTRCTDSRRLIGTHFS